MYIAGIECDNNECTILVSGCNHICEGCDSKYREFGVGKYMYAGELLNALQGKLFTTLIITGGDLFCQPIGEAIRITYEIRDRYPNIDMILYTGTKGRIPNWAIQYFTDIKKCKPKEKKNGN